MDSAVFGEKCERMNNLVVIVSGSKIWIKDIQITTDIDKECSLIEFLTSHSSSWNENAHQRRRCIKGLCCFK